jgi:hypothetical protein
MRILIISVFLSCINLALSFDCTAQNTVTPNYEIGPALVQIQIRLESSARFVQTPNRPRLQSFIRLVKETIEKNNTLGNAHAETSQKLYQLLFVYRYSTSYFKQIASDAIAVSLNEVDDYFLTISKRRGYEKLAGSNLVQLMMESMSRVTFDLVKLVSPQIQEVLKELIPKIEQARSQAAMGDRPNTYIMGDAVYQFIIDHRKVFLDVLQSQQGWETSRELLDLAEQYAAYAQFGYRVKAGSL